MTRGTFLSVLALNAASIAFAADRDGPPDRSVETGYALSNVFAWSPDGKQIACANEAGEIKIWDWPGLKEVRKLQGPPVPVRTLSWHPDSKRLASAGEHGEVHVFDASTGRVVAKVDAPAAFAAWSPDGKWLAARYNGDMGLFDETLGKPVRLLKDESGLGEFQWRPDSREAITQSKIGKRPTQQLALRVWDIEKGVAARLLSIEGAPIYRACWGPNSKELAVACRDQTLRMVDAQMGKTLKNLEPAPSIPLRLTWSPDGDFIAGRPRGASVYLWSPKTGKIERSLTVGDWGSTPVWSPDGKWLTCASRESLRFWRIERAKL